MRRSLKKDVRNAKLRCSRGGRQAPGARTDNYDFELFTHHSGAPCRRKQENKPGEEVERRPAGYDKALRGTRQVINAKTRIDSTPLSV